MSDQYIAALLRERASLEPFGKPERLADIDAELARAGYVPPKATVPVKRAQTRKG